MGFNRDVIRRRRDYMNTLGFRVRWAGRRPRLWASVIRELEIAEELTRDNKVLTLTMCVNYGGRAEIADAAKALAVDVAAGKVDPQRVDERTFARYLDEPSMPDVDLFVRSSGLFFALAAIEGSIRLAVGEVAQRTAQPRPDGDGLGTAPPYRRSRLA